MLSRFLQKADRVLFRGRGLGRIPLIVPAAIASRYFLFTHLVPVDVQGLKMYIDWQDYVGQTLLRDGIWEEFETTVFKQQVKSGMVVVDVGAHIGYYSLIAGHLVGEHGRVFAFEPDPTKYRLLVKNIRKNGLHNIVPVQKACSDISGTISLSRPPGHGCLFQEDDHGGSGKRVVVEAVRLDDFFKNHGGRPDLIKMDVEGAELCVFRGMQKTISEGDTRVIFTEFYPDGLRRLGFEPEGYLEKLIECGFALYHINEWNKSLDPVDVELAMLLCKTETFYINLLARKLD